MQGCPPRFGSIPHPTEVVLSWAQIVCVAETAKSSASVDEVRPACTDEFPMTAIDIVCRIVDDPRGDGVQVHVRNHLLEVLFGVDHPGAVSALPQPTQDSVASVVVS